ncbi:hypothetical protein [Lactococcus garvieae]|uniref:Uncharacterized protein n=1 Tax=Lactococcus garvieae DCC43 TaxID=1231377 RepID=K2PTF9_9LACT|nr:hypothetical protein [Lactococcus garvieae]EKF50786.1 hypothetical protein C426_1837 [Lactococcus garvieae DCC43]
MARTAKLYEEKVKPYLRDIRKWRDQDVSVVQVAKRLKVTQPFLNYTAKEYPELEEALKPRPLTEDELKRKAENEASYRRRYLNSTKSFIRRHATFEEKENFIQLILETSSKSEKQELLRRMNEIT